MREGGRRDRWQERGRWVGVREGVKEGEDTWMRWRGHPLTRHERGTLRLLE